MMSGGLRRGEAFAELTITGVIHAPLVSSVLWTHDTIAGIVRPVALTYRVAKNPTKQPHRSGSRPLPAGYDCPSSQLRLDVGSGFSGNHIALEFPSVDGCEILDRSVSD